MSFDLRDLTSYKISRETRKVYHNPWYSESVILKTVINQRGAVSRSLNIRVSEVLWRAFMIAIPGDLEK